VRLASRSGRCAAGMQPLPGHLNDHAPHPVWAVLPALLSTVNRQPSTDNLAAMSSATQFLPSLIQLAREASSAILDVYGTQIAVTDKADRSPLTIADLRSHEIIVKGLRALTPELPVLSEEASDISFDERRRWTRYWLVDPLDGTKEFLSRNGEFTVNIALIEAHTPVLGVVAVPVTNTVYTGVQGMGAFRQTGDELPAPIRVCSPAATPLRIVGSRSHDTGELNQYLPRLGPYTLVKTGSSLKFCLVAEGSADFYPRFGPTSEWDTAAAHAIVTAAGGRVTTTDGAPLQYNTKADLLNPHFLVFGDTSRDWPALLGLDNRA
jgi:3'(2'), 5'-bisphosphate nucleotidase